MSLLERLLSYCVPDAAGALWIGALVAFATFADYSRVFARRNLALVALLVAAPLQVDALAWGMEPGLRSAVFMFDALFVATAFYTVWGVVLARRPPEPSWLPNIPERGMAALAIILVLLDIVVLFGRAPDDAGRYTNIGAGRWVEQGVMPYADPDLRGDSSPGRGAAAAYGPLLYAAHIPAQMLVGTQRNPRTRSVSDSAYVRPPLLATKITCLWFYLIGVWALYALVTRIAGRPTALGVVAMHAGSPFLIGLGGDEFVVGGLAYISHVAPVALVLAALAASRRAFTSGVLLAAAAGLLFYPVFLIPAWLGWRFWRGDRHDTLRFAGGVLVGGAAIGALVLAFTPSQGNMGPVALFLEGTLGHQEGVAAGQYGASTFGFWGVNPSLAAFWHAPLLGASPLTTPAFLAFALFAASTFFLVRGRPHEQSLAAITAAVTAAVQLWKTHGGGTYVEWFYPLLLIAVACAAQRQLRDGRRGELPTS